jgi:hypothetical protein
LAKLNPSKQYWIEGLGLNQAHILADPRANCKPFMGRAVSYFAVFLSRFASLRENCRAKGFISRKDAKAQRLAKPN